jgi:hypothetical protein
LLSALIIILEVLLSPFVARSKYKPLKRVIGDTSIRYLTDCLSDAELQYTMGTSVGIYSEWARKAKLPIDIDELPDGGKLLWIGPKRTGNVLLYCHGRPLRRLLEIIYHAQCGPLFTGGAFIFPLQELTISFWRYIQLELEKRGVKVGIAIMSYCRRNTLSTCGKDFLTEFH